jgi:hypothetical protein
VDHGSSHKHHNRTNHNHNLTKIRHQPQHNTPHPYNHLPHSTPHPHKYLIKPPPTNTPPRQTSQTTRRHPPWTPRPIHMTQRNTNPHLHPPTEQENAAPATNLSQRAQPDYTTTAKEADGTTTPTASHGYTQQITHRRDNPSPPPPHAHQTKTAASQDRQ